jgi:hypothetical protein
MTRRRRRERPQVQRVSGTTRDRSAVRWLTWPLRWSIECTLRGCPPRPALWTRPESNIQLAQLAQNPEPSCNEEAYGIGGQRL